MGRCVCVCVCAHACVCKVRGNYELVVCGSVSRDFCQQEPTPLTYSGIFFFFHNTVS